MTKRDLGPEVLRKSSDAEKGEGGEPRRDSGRTVSEDAEHGPLPPRQVECVPPGGGRERGARTRDAIDTAREPIHSPHPEKPSQAVVHQPGSAALSCRDETCLLCGQCDDVAR